MPDPFGGDFQRNLDRELARQSVHGADRGRDRPAKPKARKASGPPGAPGSRERMEYAASLIEDPELRQQLVSELHWGQVGVHLQNALHQIKRDESRDDFWDYGGEPNYSPESVAAFESAARMLTQVGDPNLLAAFVNELGEESPLLEYLEPVMQQAATEGRIEAYSLAKAQEEKRLGERQQMLEREYQDIERRTGQAGLEAADQLVQNLNEDGLLYDPHADEFVMRGSMRQLAENAAATKRGEAAASFLTEMDKEITRIGAPGSSWSDEERANWERDLKLSTIETVERAYGNETDHANRAVDGMYLDDRRRALGKSVFEERLDAEFDRMAQHDSRSEHAQALAKEDAEEFRQTHDETGRKSVEYDGLGREHGGRYE